MGRDAEGGHDPASTALRIQAVVSRLGRDVPDCDQEFDGIDMQGLRDVRQFDGVHTAIAAFDGCDDGPTSSQPQCRFRSGRPGLLAGPNVQLDQLRMTCGPEGTGHRPVGRVVGGADPTGRISDYRKISYCEARFVKDRREPPIGVRRDDRSEAHGRSAVEAIDDERVPNLNVVEADETTTSPDSTAD